MVDANLALSKTVVETSIYGAKIFHDNPSQPWGAMGLDGLTFIALKGDRMAVVGEPNPDVWQAAFAATAFDRFDVTKVPQGYGRKAITGLVLDLTV